MSVHGRSRKSSKVRLGMPSVGDSVRIKLEHFKKNGRWKRPTSGFVHGRSFFSDDIGISKNNKILIASANKRFVGYSSKLYYIAKILLIEKV